MLPGVAAEDVGEADASTDTPRDDAGDCVARASLDVGPRCTEATLGDRKGVVGPESLSLGRLLDVEDFILAVPFLDIGSGLFLLLVDAATGGTDSTDTICDSIEGSDFRLTCGIVCSESCSVSSRSS